jgi:hypothetical protein
MRLSVVFELWLGRGEKLQKQFMRTGWKKQFRLDNHL